MKSRDIPLHDIASKWLPSIFEYAKTVLYAKHDVDEKIEENLTLNMVTAMANIGESWATSYRKNDSVNILRNDHNLQEVHLKFKKLKTNIYFGFDYEGFYVSNYLSFQHCLSSTNDDFWNDFFTLFKNGKVKYPEPIRPEIPKEKKRVFERNKSATINLFLDFILNALDNKNDLIGLIEVRIEESNSHADLFSKLSNCVEAFQSLNYQLFHIDYLHSRSRPKTSA